MSRAHILLTRPKAESLKTLENLQEEGFEVSISPILSIHLNSITLPTEYDAIIATSQHGVAAIDAPTNDPLYVVGDASAALAKERGWQDVRIAPKGDGESLIQRIKEDYPEPACFSYVRGVDVKHDMAFRLSNFNHEVNEIIAYEAQASETLDANILHSLAQIECALFYSLRSVEIFQELTTNIDISHITALCISRHTATACAEEKWQRILVSDAPNAQSIMDMVRKTY